MNIEGTYTLQAAPEEIWAGLMDLQTLRYTIPGIGRLERHEGDIYTFTMHIRHAPLRGAYSGRAAVLEQEYPLSYRMTVEGEGQAGKFHGEWAIELRPHNENTVVGYKGTLHLTKAGALLPASLVKGTIKVLTHQFFTTLADHLRTVSSSYTVTSENMSAPAEFKQIDNGHIVMASSPHQPALLRMIVRELGLGGNDPQLEVQWVIRLRRVGFASMLLLLVWVGTRLPRKPGDRKGRHYISSH